jgi:hypothetical protein
MSNSRFGFRTLRGQISDRIEAVGIIDADALAYIEAVQNADNDFLEAEVQLAINDFVTGCKVDGVWDAIKSSCILAGAKTLTGALIPLKGLPPTGFNLVAGDYDRKLGIIGNSTNKYIDIGRNNNADPQNDNHNAAYVNNIGGTYIGTIGSNLTGNNVLGGTVFRNRSSLNSPTVVDVTGFRGASRSSNANFTYRISGVNQTAIITSATPQNTGLVTHRFAGIYTSTRISFYSIGEALDLALLDSRVTALMNAYDAAI